METNPEKVSHYKAAAEYAKDHIKHTLGEIRKEQKTLSKLSDRLRGIRADRSWKPEFTAYAVPYVPNDDPYGEFGPKKRVEPSSHWDLEFAVTDVVERFKEVNVNVIGDFVDVVVEIKLPGDLGKVEVPESDFQAFAKTALRSQWEKAK